VSDEGQAAADRLVALLDLELVEPDVFRGGNPDSTPLTWVYGGQVAAQALMAAGRTVEADRAVHSLHAYFVRSGDPSVPITFRVDRIRDGRSFSVRRVVAQQDGVAIFMLSSSFQLPQPGIDNQAPMPPSPPPDSLPDPETVESMSGRPVPPRFSAWPFELRRVPTEPGSTERERSLIWLRARGRLPDDPLLQACVLTFASDLIPVDTMLMMNHIDRSTQRLRTASLDHAVWFHRPFRVDEWLLHESESPSASGARGLAISRIFRADGQQAATTTQEAMIRVL